MMETLFNIMLGIMIVLLFIVVLMLVGMVFLILRDAFDLFIRNYRRKR